MKNKALTYILLIVVAIIWYQVFFRVKGNLFGEDEVIADLGTTRQELPSLARDTVVLNANYRDPFTLTKRSPVNLDVEVANAKPKENRPKPQIVWPVIKYYGLVQRTYSNKPLAIVNVDGVQLMLRKGDEVFDGIYIMSIDREVIKVRYKKEVKEIFR